MDAKYVKLRDLIAVLQRFNQFDHKMQVSTMLTFLEIAAADMAKKEITPIDLEKLTGLMSGTMTRNVYYWENGYKDVTGAHNMIVVRIHPSDRRKRLLNLNAKGRGFLESILAIGERNGTTEGQQVPS